MRAAYRAMFLDCGNTIFAFSFFNKVILFNRYSDITIIEGVRRQDDKILNWIYDNYYQSVKKHVLNNSGSAEDVSDVFQDSIIVLYNQISENSFKLTSDLKRLLLWNCK
jgi:hypothetical protein